MKNEQIQQIIGSSSGPNLISKQPPDNKFVLFADILGFALLTESHPLDLKAFKLHERIFSEEFSENILKALANGTFTPLIKAFAGFHDSLRWIINRALMEHPLTAITFSDSAFMVTSQLHEAANIAIYLLKSLIYQGIPVRIGIAYGSFAALRFRSDIVSDGGDHAAHFLGTGVVRSHKTESCGINGLRILLHPSIDQSLYTNGCIQSQKNNQRISILECSENELCNDLGVRYELDYWQFRPTEEARAWHALQDMWSSAPESAVKHYKATAEAINRMRIGQGELPLKDLRRRTLPRRDK